MLVNYYENCKSIMKIYLEKYLKNYIFCLDYLFLLKNPMTPPWLFFL